MEVADLEAENCLKEKRRGDESEIELMKVVKVRIRDQVEKAAEPSMHVKAWRCIVGTSFA
jgi:hypothetical protein